MTALAPVFYIPHGGGPMPLLNDPAHSRLIAFLQQLPQRYAKPEAYVVISAHWEANVPSVYGGQQHPMLFDYYGFPPHTYQFRYGAPAAPAISRTIADLLRQEELQCSTETARGFDHGTFVPMLLIDPQASVPCIQLSLLKGLSPHAHVGLGLALQRLREHNVVIIGSGMSFHNLQAVWAGPDPRLQVASNEFHQWLLQTTSDTTLTAQQRLQRLNDWQQQAPYAQFAHPRAEHLLPLHVCAGIAGGAAAQVLFDEELMHHKVLGVGWL
jgi:4,5-DOPA dioxygenase extradiol